MALILNCGKCNRPISPSAPVRVVGDVLLGECCFGSKSQVNPTPTTSSSNGTYDYIIDFLTRVKGFSKIPISTFTAVRGGSWNTLSHTGMVFNAKKMTTNHINLVPTSYRNTICSVWFILQEGMYLTHLWVERDGYYEYIDAFDDPRAKFDEWYSQYFQD